MLNKITQIANISRFKHFSSSDPKLTLSSSNLIFAPNGRGKTTISDLLQSMIKDDPEIMIRRLSRIYTGNSEVTITHSDPMITARFTSTGRWTNALKDVNCIVFDKNFIHQNIHTVTVEHDHKKKLHGLIVGEGAIEARQQVSEKRSLLTELQKQKKAIEKEYTLLNVANLTIDEFSKMKVEDLDVLAGEKLRLKKQLEAVGNPEAIKAKPNLSMLVEVYQSGEDLQSACEDVVVGGSKDAVELLKEHSNAHISGTEDERRQFLATGVKALGKVDTPNCALCGQSIEGDADQLIKSLFAIFSQNYLSLRKKISESNNRLKSLNDDTNFNQISESIEMSINRYGEWVNYIPGLPALYLIPGLAVMKETIVRTKLELISKLELKSENMSDIIELELKRYEEAVNAFSVELQKFNARVEEINLKINLFKSKIDISQKQQIQVSIKDVNNRIIRSSPSSVVLAAKYLVNEPEVFSAGVVYKQALIDFAVAQKAVIDKHGDMINDVLEYCNAKFRLTGIAQGERPGSTDPYIEYSITLVGGTEDALTSASDAMGYILSDGEKNLLAFAFFWSLINHTDLSKTIAIFDDPLSSIDQNWRNQLIDKLKELSDTGLMQLFMLTHYEDFARIAALRFSNLKQLSIELGGAVVGNKIIPFDIEIASRDVQYERIDKLQAFVDDPSTADPKDIQAEIRKCLESAMKSKYYLKLAPLIGKKWLRDFIEDSQVKPMLELNGSYRELDVLCINGGWANHDNPPSLIFDVDQAQAYALRTLKVIELL